MNNSTQFVYRFGGPTKSDRTDKESLGGKGANLAEMDRIGLPVPPGFTITTDVCRQQMEQPGAWPDDLRPQVDAAVREIEEVTSRRFGDLAQPLLLSVRSGARESMPGMMDTILNLGLNDQTVRGLAEMSGDERFAWDCYRRFLSMFGDVVLGVRPEGPGQDPFEVALEAAREARGVSDDADLTVDDLKALVDRFRAIIAEHTGEPVPDDPSRQLELAIDAVFSSWGNPRAYAYRRLNSIPDEWGTAVNVMAMVFGNLGDDSATGVAFTRDPASGEAVLYGEYLVNAQGEDVVAGVRTPLQLVNLAKDFPAEAEQLDSVCKLLEGHFKDMQDLEFTIEQHRLWMLQTRSGKRTGRAAVRIASDLVAEGLITPLEAVRRIDAAQLDQVLQPVFEQAEISAAKAEGRFLGSGLPAGPGAASGRPAFTANEAVELKAAGFDVILIRLETSPDDIDGMVAAEGIVTARGGMTSHAALVARQMGKVCVVGCEDLRIDPIAKTLELGGTVLGSEDHLSVDGFSGKLFAGDLEAKPSPVLKALLSGEGADEPLVVAFQRLLGWADDFKKMEVKVNADTPDQAKEAIALGARGIGLCRTEHMFFGEERIGKVRNMILAENDDERAEALAALEPLQCGDFVSLFEEMNGYPVRIRTLDPPLHEFLPHTTEEFEALAEETGRSAAALQARAGELKEANPMLGHRGCRLGVSHPEITRMQARAILRAACKVAKTGRKVRPEIMIPLVSYDAELRHQAACVHEVAAEVFAEEGIEVSYQVGTMIELPRAALTAAEIATSADFFSFGTNDLTQTALGLSRDDFGRFLPDYIEQGIVEVDPFVELDRDGVGRLVAYATEAGRAANPKLEIGICGEHGGDPSSIEFCQQIGLDSISCSPRRLPIARLAAAHAALAQEVE